MAHPAIMARWKNFVRPDPADFDQIIKDSRWIVPAHLRLWRSGPPAVRVRFRTGRADEHRGCSACLSPKGREVAPRRRRGANGSDFGVLSKGKRVFHVDPEIAHRALYLAMTEKDLDGTKVAGRLVDDRCLRSAK